MAESHKIVFTPSGLSGHVDEGSTVLDAARELGVDVDSVCGGRGLCGRCQIQPVNGEFPKWDISATAEHLNSWTGTETDYKGRRKIADGHRLGCAAVVHGDVVIDVPEASQMHKQVVRKSVDVGDLVVDPIVTLHYLELETLHELDAESVTDRVRKALASAWSLDTVDIPTSTLRTLQFASAKQTGAMTVAIHRGFSTPRLITAWPGYRDTGVGMAVDIGSTTVAGHLCDLATGEVLASAGRMNPQIRFGEDLMSRVSYVMMNPGGDDELTAAIRTALAELLDELVEQVDLLRNDVLDVVLVGNPIMHHLVLGFDPVPLGQAPFPLATDDPVHTTARELGIESSATVYFAPCIAGHVGADTAGAILSEGPHRSDEVQLLVDVGTNAEIVLGNSTQLWAASSPTGPAFEGAQISAGQRATAGAIERVRIDRTTLEPRIKVIGCDLWSDEDGFAEQTAKSGVTGICGSGIIEVVSEMFLSGITDVNGVIQESASARSSRVVADERTYSYVLHAGSEDTGDDNNTGQDHNELRVTQGDIRAIQLAKAALRAGIDLLMEHAGLDSVSDIRLAGAFGAHIDPVHAMVLGLIPDCPVECVRSVGNAAGSGAVRALLSTQQRSEMETAVAAVTKIETAVEPRFQELFVNAMGFPHTTAETPQLAQVVDLPERTAAAEPGRRRRSRSRG